jgi:xylose isomerase
MKPAFPEISKIAYEGPASKNPLAFKNYDSAKVIENRTNANHPLPSECLYAKTLPVPARWPSTT